jgi:beta-phosphoglucomutase-like phosphatase (HAD superfamily)
VIFDCDGVLVDSERIAVRIDAAVLSQLGWDLTQDEIIERFVGRSQEFVVSEVEAHLGRRLAPDWEDPHVHLYREAFAAELHAVDGVLEALDQITVRTCVASSGSHEKMRYTLGLAASRVARQRPPPGSAVASFGVVETRRRARTTRPTHVPDCE